MDAMVGIRADREKPKREELSRRRTVYELLDDPALLKAHIIRKLASDMSFLSRLETEKADGAVASSVLLLLGWEKRSTADPGDVCLILNKRSRKVRQAGDLCCPGGSVENHLDSFLSWLLLAPGLPPHVRASWQGLQEQSWVESRKALTLLAAGLREGWEEMRLNPFRVRFLGALAPQRLLLFKRVIQPFVVWVSGQNRFRTNWEVEKVVRIPLWKLLCEDYYARYRIYMDTRLQDRFGHRVQDFPCFLHQDGTEVDILWGATFKIVMGFLEKIFDFYLPDISARPIVPGMLNNAYLHNGV